MAIRGMIRLNPSRGQIFGLNHTFRPGPLSPASSARVVVFLFLIIFAYCLCFRFPFGRFSLDAFLTAIVVCDGFCGTWFAFGLLRVQWFGFISFTGWLGVYNCLLGLFGPGGGSPGGMDLGG